MILEFVTFKTPADWDRARVLEDAKHTIPKWVANHDLLRKHFALGVGADDGTSAGIYIWPSVEAAKKAHNDEWREAVKTRSGGYPTIQYFDLFLLIDNEHRQVTEWAADGKARELDAA
jgi:hypothetical protein